MSEKPLVPAEVRNRIVEVRKARYGDIKQLAHNPKDHPEFQRQAFRGAVRQIGFASVPLAYWSAKLDAWAWVDGHLRGGELPDYEGDVAFTDFNDQEVEFALVTMDPIAYLAKANTEMLGGLLENIEAESAAVQEMIARYAEAAGMFPPEEGGDEGGDKDPDEIETRYKEQYGVIVMCQDEAEQERVYNQLAAEGLTVKVVST